MFKYAGPSAYTGVCIKQVSDVCRMHASRDFAREMWVQMGVRWVSDGCQVGVRCVSDGCQIGVQKVPALRSLNGSPSRWTMALVTRGKVRVDVRVRVAE